MIQIVICICTIYVQQMFLDFQNHLNVSCLLSYDFCFARIRSVRATIIQSTDLSWQPYFRGGISVTMICYERIRDES